MMAYAWDGAACSNHGNTVHNNKLSSNEQRLPGTIDDDQLRKVLKGGDKQGIRDFLENVWK